MSVHRQHCQHHRQTAAVPQTDPGTVRAPGGGVGWRGTRPEQHQYPDAQGVFLPERHQTEDLPGWSVPLLRRAQHRRSHSHTALCADFAGWVQPGNYYFILFCQNQWDIKIKNKKHSNTWSFRLWEQHNLKRMNRAKRNIGTQCKCCLLVMWYGICKAFNLFNILFI